MKAEIQKQENIELNNDNQNFSSSNNKILNSNKNSENKTQDCNQKQNKNETNSENNNNSKISLNKEQLYETFLLFQNYLSTNQKEQINNDSISQFNMGNEELHKNFITSMQLYKQNNIKKSTEENLNDIKSLNFSKREKKFLNESFTLNAKNISNEYSYDFSNNNLDTNSASIGDSLQLMAYDLLNNKNKLNEVNACNKTTKS